MTQRDEPQNVDFLWLRCLVLGVKILPDFTGACTWPCPFLTYHFCGADHNKNGNLFDDLNLCQNLIWSLAMNRSKLKTKFPWFVFFLSVVRLYIIQFVSSYRILQTSISFYKGFLCFPFHKDSYTFLFCIQYGKFNIMQFVIEIIFADLLWLELLI